MVSVYKYWLDALLVYKMIVECGQHRVQLLWKLNFFKWLWLFSIILFYRLFIKSLSTFFIYLSVPRPVSEGQKQPEGNSGTSFCDQQIVWKSMSILNLLGHILLPSGRTVAVLYLPVKLIIFIPFSYQPSLFFIGHSLCFCTASFLLCF